MTISEQGNLIEGEVINPGIQTTYDLRVHFIQNPITPTRFQALNDAFEMIKGDKTLEMLALNNVKDALLLNNYDLEFLYPLYDRTRLELFNNFKSRLQ